MLFLVNRIFITNKGIQQKLSRQQQENLIRCKKFRTSNFHQRKIRPSSQAQLAIQVEPPSSYHPKCKLNGCLREVVFHKIEPQGISSEKRSGHIIFMVDNVMHAISTVQYDINLAPRGLFPSFGGGAKARKQCPGDKVGTICVLPCCL